MQTHFLFKLAANHCTLSKHVTRANTTRAFSMPRMPPRSGPSLPEWPPRRASHTELRRQGVDAARKPWCLAWARTRRPQNQDCGGLFFGDCRFGWTSMAVSWSIKSCDSSNARQGLSAGREAHWAPWKCQGAWGEGRSAESKCQPRGHPTWHGQLWWGGWQPWRAVKQPDPELFEWQTVGSTDKHKITLNTRKGLAFVKWPHAGQTSLPRKTPRQVPQSGTTTNAIGLHDILMTSSREGPRKQWELGQQEARRNTCVSEPCGRAPTCVQVQEKILQRNITRVCKCKRRSYNTT